MPPASQAQARRRPSGAQWTGGREGPVRMWQGGEGESGQPEGRPGGLTFGPAHTTVTGHAGWMEARAHGHKHRQTDVYAEAAQGLRPASAAGPGARRCPSTLCGSPPAQQLTREPPSLGAHDLAGPRLVGSMWGQLGEHHLHSLELLVLGWDGAHLVGHLVAFHGHVLPLDAGGRERGVSPAAGPTPRHPLRAGLRAASPPFSELQLESVKREPKKVPPCLCCLGIEP